MKRVFWTAALLVFTFSGGWTLFVGAQELQSQIGFKPESSVAAPRFHFTEHFFLKEGQPYEIILRLDRQTGQTWRYHATQTQWTVVKESSGAAPAADYQDRYELLSHVYRNPQGIQLERMMRIDYLSGRSWMYETTAEQWNEIEIEVGPSADQQALMQPEDVKETE
jgi:hypothetical protein